jgi:hypothetical protein
MQALGFTLDDLNCNRARQMSERQHYQLRVRRRRSIAIGVLITLVMVFIASLLIFFGSREDGSFILTIVGIGVTLCNAALVGVLARHWLRLSADIREGTVQAISDTLERVIKPVNRRVFNYAIRVGEAEVFVSKEAFEAFAHNTPYTIYRAPHTGALFSAERHDS